MAYTERYVSVLGGGLHDGTSEANAWTLAEMLTNIVAGERGNIISGAYSSIADALTNTGTVVSLIAIRGYTSTIGDLEGQGRNADGSLDTTNFPVITVTGVLATNTYSVWQNITVTGSVATYNFGSTGVDHVTLIASKFVQASTGVAVLGDNNYTLIDCDIESTAINHPDVLSVDAYANIIGCRIKGAATSGAYHLITSVSASIVDCVFIGTSSLIAIGIESTGQPWLIKNNTIYNCAKAVELADVVTVTIPIFINNHVTDNAEYLDSLYSGTANSVVIEVNNRTRDNTTDRTGIGDGVLIGEVTTDTGGIATDYVNAGADNLRLISGAPGESAGLIAYADIGAYQREPSAGGSGGMLMANKGGNKQ